MDPTTPPQLEQLRRVIEVYARVQEAAQKNKGINVQEWENELRKQTVRASGIGAVSLN